MAWLDSIINGAINTYRDYENRQWQEKMMDKQNEYNLPINQRKRLEEAGINPNLAFGSSASGGISASPPSSPTQHETKVDIQEFLLKKKQVEAEIKKQEADVRRDDQLTEQLRLHNEMLSELFNDKVITERGDMYVKRIMQGWQEDNLRRSLDTGLLGQELSNDLKVIQKDLMTWQTEKTKVSVDRLKQDLQHLEKKYGFEEGYFSQHVNPYETSTAAGFFRMIYGYLISTLEAMGLGEYVSPW